MRIFLNCLILVLVGCSAGNVTKPIDRRALVQRHQIIVNRFDSLSSLTVGNGAFALTVDATGLQTFPDFYQNGVSLGTQSDWGWHSFPNVNGYRLEEAYKPFTIKGRTIHYAVQWKDNERKSAAANYFRVNPHRLHLGLVGLKLTHADGSEVKIDELQNVEQKMDLWTGIIESRFVLDGEWVNVTTSCHSSLDVVGIRIVSPLISKGQVSVQLKFPFPDGRHVGTGCDWTQPEKHTSVLQNVTGKGARIVRGIDTTQYIVGLKWTGEISIQEPEPHRYLINGMDEELALSVSFSETEMAVIPIQEEVDSASVNGWQSFWMRGGAIDMEGSTDPRAFELERRIILSQYLTRVQCAGDYPPQETGLTFNSWYGKFHLEMDWWHGVHFALWNRLDLLEKRLDWYHTILTKARAKALRQGFDGARWPKMTDRDGNDSPSSVGEMLIWQQPHIIYFAELCYRQKQDTATLKKYSQLVFETANFMASYAIYNPFTEKYDLGPGLIPAQECFDPNTTLNPPFELVYWKWALQTALKWENRLGLEENKKWKEVADHMAPLSIGDGKYLVAESSKDTYSNPKWLMDHPMVLGAYGVLDGQDMVDTEVMNRTYDHVMKHWNWHDTWGWDYPMIAMSAVRLNRPDMAIEGLLMNVQKNTYLINGHNYQDNRLRIYLPGNGGLLTAAAMMCAGFDGCEVLNPGIPKDGKWVVRWEGLMPMP